MLAFPLCPAKLLSVNCSIFFVVWHHDKNNLTLKILSRAIKIAKVTCSSWASVTKPADEVLAGQKRYAAAEWERAWTRSPRALSGCSGIAVSPFPDPSPSVFPVASLCSGRYSVCASSWSLKLCLYFILFYPDIANDQSGLDRLVKLLIEKWSNQAHNESLVFTTGLSNPHVWIMTWPEPAWSGKSIFFSPNREKRF